MFIKSEANFYKTPDNEQIFFVKNFDSVDESKPVLVFNYGLVCSNHHWKFQLNHFDRLGFQLVIQDYRGHFQSTGGNDIEKMTFKQFAEDIHGLCQYLGIKRAYMLGHSMGVNVCLQLAKDFPELVRGMVLISGTFMPVKDIMFDSNVMEFLTPTLTAALDKYPAFMKKVWSSAGFNPLVKAIIHSTGFNKDKVSREFIDIYMNRVSQLGIEVFFQLFEEMTKQNIVSNLQQMNIPSLVIGGHNDNVIPNHLQRTLAELLPQSETYFLKTGSHVPQADYPEMINERIELFINQNP